MKEINDRMVALGRLISLDATYNGYPKVVEKEDVFTDGKFLYEDKKVYHYVVMERGKEVESYSSGIVDEVLYFVFKDITRSLAIKYESEHSVPNQDFRKIMFQRQLELLSEINPDYEEKQKSYIQDVLAKNPYT
ncbi:Imm63 family immunity protein [Lactovum odontotermitis]